MRYVKGIKTDLQILTLLAKKKEVAQYDMPKQLDKTYRTVLYHLPPLEEKGLIKVSKEEHSDRGGKDRKFYTLTIAGLIEILGFETLESKPTYKMIDLIAENYADMFPLILGKWSFFIEENKREIAMKRLAYAAAFYHRYVPSKTLREWTSELHLKEVEFLKKKHPDFEMISDIVDDFTKIFLAEPFVYNSLQAPRDSYPKDLRQELEEWFTTLRKEPELKAFIDRTLKFQEKHRKFRLESFMSWKNWWHNLP